MAMETQDPYDLRSRILNVFFPARDTAAIAFGNIVFYHARRPQVWSELRNEVLKLGSQDLTFELRRALKTTKAIINETLRLHMPASRVFRTALGLAAGEFRPERWSDGRPLWEANWQYEPFLGAMRMCPAQNQLITQLSYLLVRMAQNFQVVENRDNVWEYNEEIKMTLESRNGVKVALIPV